MPERALPAGFEDLEQWVADWALPTEPQRNVKRRTSSMAQLQAFYDSMLGRMDDLIGYLNTRPYGQFDGPDQTLLNLGLMFMEAGGAVDVFHAPDVPNGFDADRFQIMPPRRLDPTYL